MIVLFFNAMASKRVWVFNDRICFLKFLLYFSVANGSYSDYNLLNDFKNTQYKFCLLCLDARVLFFGISKGAPVEIMWIVGVTVGGIWSSQRAITDIYNIPSIFAILLISGLTVCCSAYFGPIAANGTLKLLTKHK